MTSEGGKLEGEFSFHGRHENITTLQQHHNSNTLCITVVQYQWEIKSHSFSLDQIQVQGVGKLNILVRTDALRTMASYNNIIKYYPRAICMNYQKLLSVERIQTNSKVQRNVFSLKMNSPKSPRFSDSKRRTGHVASCVLLTVICCKESQLA